jgi:subtilisin family serine protease
MIVLFIIWRKPMRLFIFINFIFCLSFASTFQVDSANQWHLHFNDESGGANVVAAWNHYKKNHKIVVAIIENAIADTNHEDLKNQFLINENEIPDNGIDDDKNGFVDDYKAFNACTNSGSSSNLVVSDHATFVAGIVAAEHNGVGISGINNDVSILTVGTGDKVDSKCGSSIGHPNQEEHANAFAKAINYSIKKGAHIINISYGFGSWPSSNTLHKAFQNAYDENVIIVISAGNDSSASVRTYPQIYGKLFGNVILVAASNRKVKKWEKSTYSSRHVHIFAPGQDIYSTLKGNNYGFRSGTSSSAPIVAGVISLILSKEGADEAQNIRKRLINTSRKFQDLDGKVYSNGLINAKSALLNQLSLPLRWEK